MTTTPYTYITLAQLRQYIANRLYDSGQIFWSPPELNLLIAEALRTWNALTGYWRDDFLFTPSQGTTWYDITSLSQMPNTLRALTLTDRYLYSVIQYHLLEAVAWNPWTGKSNQFGEGDLVGAVGRRRDELLSATSCSITRRTVPAVSGRIRFPDTVIDVRRLAYLPAIGDPSVLWPEDAWGEQSFDASYLQTPPGTPLTYLMSTQPPISFDTNCAPIAAGSYEALTVEAGPTLAAATAQLLTVPDDWTWVIKWGALADLLSRDEEARDVPRAEYANQRYRMGLAALAAAPALLAARIGNVAVPVDAVRAADLYNTSWEAAAQGPPSAIYHAGLNALALSPSPDAARYSITLTVIRNAIIPVLDADYVQVGRDVLDAIIDYVEHLSLFKSGGAEFAATTPLLQRFLKVAATYNRKLLEIAEFQSMLAGVSQLEQNENPVMTPDDGSDG